MASSRDSFFQRNGLSIVLLTLFIAFWTAQIVSGRAALNHERIEQHLPALSTFDYLGTGHFLSATFENWESEFLQMGMYVLLTVGLRQRGSAESRPLDRTKEQERVEKGVTPWPLRYGGIWKVLYAHSLSAAFLALFVLAFLLHGWGSWLHENEQRAARGLLPMSWSSHMTDSQFWFESMQNWQSEFLAVLSIVVLSIFLRQDRSPESKPLRAPHSQTGN